MCCNDIIKINIMQSSKLSDMIIYVGAVNISKSLVLVVGIVLLVVIGRRIITPA